MSQPNDGGPAFPLAFTHAEMGHFPGMSLRDYFAAHALAGELAHQSLKNCDADEMATACYQLADAMLAARKRSQE